MPRKTGIRKKPENFKKLKDTKPVCNYIVNHVRHGCYEVLLRDGERLHYLTNFRNKKAADSFIAAHKRDEVTIDPDTRIPTPDFK